MSAPLDASSSMGKKMKKAKIQKVDYHTQQNDEIMVNTPSTLILILILILVFIFILFFILFIYLFFISIFITKLILTSE